MPKNIGAVFFREFARLEYMLKRKGVIEPDNNQVKVDWNNFADLINTIFEQSLLKKDFRKAVEFIEKEPPKKLVRDSTIRDRLCWKDSPPNQGSRLRDLLVYIRRIRNNLFHGEKPNVFIGGTNTDPRDTSLLKYGVTILEELEFILRKDLDSL